MNRTQAAMRTPSPRRMSEINNLMEGLRRAWFHHGNLRLGQFLQGYVWTENHPLTINADAVTPRDIYEYGDDETMARVLELLREETA